MIIFPSLSVFSNKAKSKTALLYMSKTYAYPPDEDATDNDIHLGTEVFRVIAVRGDVLAKLVQDCVHQIVLADEISPDTSRLWDEKTNEKLDKDRFRRDLGGVEDAYAEVMRRLNEHIN